MNLKNLQPLAMAAACLVGGCNVVPTVMPRTGPVAIASIPPTHDWARPVALDIDNQAGSVTVIVDASFRRAEVLAVTTDGSGSRVAAPWAAADLEAAEPHSILRVLAKGEASRKGQTDLVVHVPACAGLRIRNAEGPVQVSGAAGAVDIQNGSDVQAGGDVIVSMDRPLNGPMMLRSSRGAVRLDLPAKSRGLFTAMSGIDDVTLVAPRERVEAGKAAASDWSCDINDGEFDVRLIADRGRIVIRVGL